MPVRMSTENEQLRYEIAYLTRLIDAEKERRQANGFHLPAETKQVSWPSSHQQGQGQQHQGKNGGSRAKIYVNPSMISCNGFLHQKSDSQPAETQQVGSAETVSSRVSLGQVRRRTETAVSPAETSRTVVLLSRSVVPGGKSAPKLPASGTDSSTTQPRVKTSHLTAAAPKPRACSAPCVETRVVRATGAVPKATSSSPEKIQQRLKEELVKTQTRIKELKEFLQEKDLSSSRQHSTGKEGGKCATSETSVQRSEIDVRQVRAQSVKPRASETSVVKTGRDTSSDHGYSTSGMTLSKLVVTRSPSSGHLSGGGQRASGSRHVDKKDKGPSVMKAVAVEKDRTPTTSWPDSNTTKPSCPTSASSLKPKFHLERMSKLASARAPRLAETQTSLLLPVEKNSALARTSSPQQKTVSKPTSREKVPSQRESSRLSKTNVAGKEALSRGVHSRSVLQSSGCIHGSGASVVLRQVTQGEALAALQSRAKAEHCVQQSKSPAISIKSSLSSPALSSPRAKTQTVANLPTRAQLTWKKSTVSPKCDISKPVDSVERRSTQLLAISAASGVPKIDKVSPVKGSATNSRHLLRNEGTKVTPKSNQSGKVIASKYKFRKVGASQRPTGVETPRGHPLTKTISSRYKLQKVGISNSSLAKSKSKSPASSKVFVSKYKIRKGSDVGKTAKSSPYNSGYAIPGRLWRPGQHSQSKMRNQSMIGSQGAWKYGAAVWHHCPKHLSKAWLRNFRQKFPYCTVVSGNLSWQNPFTRTLPRQRASSSWMWGQETRAGLWYQPWTHTQQVLKRVRHLQNSSARKHSKLKLDRRTGGKSTVAGGSLPSDQSSRVVMINGILYRSSRRKLSKTSPQSSSSQSSTPSRSLSSSVVIKQLRGAAMKTVTVRGVKFKLNNSGRTLQRMEASHPPSPCKQESGLRSKTEVKRVDIGGVTYVQTKPGTLERLASVQSRLRASRVVKSSIARASAKFRKDNTPSPKRFCMFYNRFGKCKRGDRCPYIHDPDKVAVCTRFLRGTCKVENCQFSHKVSPEKMAVCSYFLRGICSRSDCPYLHVKVNRDAQVCKDFLRGYCPLGRQCKKLHSQVCQAFARTGACPEGDRCRLKHIRKTRKPPAPDGRPPALSANIPPPLASSTPVRPPGETAEPASRPASILETPASPSQSVEVVLDASPDCQSDAGSTVSEAVGDGSLEEGERSGVFTPPTAIRRGLKRRLGTPEAGRTAPKLAKLPSFISLAGYSMESSTTSTESPQSQDSAQPGNLNRVGLEILT